MAINAVASIDCERKPPMQLTINPDELRRGFDAYVLEWERTGKRKLVHRF